MSIKLLEQFRSVPASGAAQTLDCGGGSITYDVTETTDCVYSLTGAVAGQVCQITLIRRQDSVGGHVPTFAFGLSCTIPSPTLVAGKYDALTFTSIDGGATWMGSAAVIGGVNVPSAPTSPTTLVATPGNAQVTLTWVGSTGMPAPTGYIISRGVASGAETQLTTVAATARSYVDSAAANGTTYFYTVTAVNSIGPSAPSTEVSGTANALGNNGRALVLPGSASAYASTPNASAMSVPGDLDIRSKVALTNWASPGTTQGIIGKWGSSASAQGYYLFLDTTSRPTLAFFPSGGSAKIAAATSGLTALSAGAAIWIRTTLAYATGTVTFYTSSDGINWTQLGNTVAPGSTTAIQATTGSLVAGNSDTAGTNSFSGSISYVEVRAGISGSIVAAADFSAQQAGTTSFTGSAGNVWTLNGTATIA